jgi:hypothetical protein
MRQPDVAELLTSIRHGNIDETREWIRSGRVLRWQPRKNALNDAVKTGFFSMVQMLLEKLSWDSDELGNAMLLALVKRRVDLVYILLENGAPPEYADFYDVFGCMDHGLMARFLGYGLDPCHDFAFARILEDTRARPLLWFYKTYRERYHELDDQIAMAWPTRSRTEIFAGAFFCFGPEQIPIGLFRKKWIPARTPTFQCHRLQQRPCIQVILTSSETLNSD